VELAIIRNARPPGVAFRSRCKWAHTDTHRFLGRIFAHEKQGSRDPDENAPYPRGCSELGFASRSRFAFYDYLAAVFGLYVLLRRTNRAKTSARRIAKLFKLRNQKRSHPIRVIINATSTADLKTRSRWTRALRLAWRDRRTWKDLGSFMRENGGPAGCAKQFAAITKKNQPYIIYRYAGTGRPYLIVHKGV
jgi:hypothetical protein